MFRSTASCMRRKEQTGSGNTSRDHFSLMKRFFIKYFNLYYYYLHDCIIIALFNAIQKAFYGGRMGILGKI